MGGFQFNSIIYLISNHRKHMALIYNRSFDWHVNQQDDEFHCDNLFVWVLELNFTLLRSIFNTTRALVFQIIVAFFTENHPSWRWVEGWLMYSEVLQSKLALLTDVMAIGSCIQLGPTTQRQSPFLCFRCPCLHKQSIEMRGKSL